ncbi:cation-transporting P-type ATPase [Methanosarcina barkeri]|uniref:cation-transporting P-type ATPase n=1 Tax=Methanosarcina barkeri TaxID=2208 RepID=UPI001FB451A8|nr:cation-transporting P-type ATPase [Methanosarcina barkeri]
MYYDEAADAVLKTLNTSEETGLSSEEAEKRFDKYGKNELKEEEKTSVVKLFSFPVQEFSDYNFDCCSTGFRFSRRVC